MFHPFRNEKDDIHSRDVKQLLLENREDIERKRALFEKYKLMTDLVSTIQSEIDEDQRDIVDAINSADNETKQLHHLILMSLTIGPEHKQLKILLI